MVPWPGCARRNRVPAAATGVPRCASCHRPLSRLVAAGDADVARVADACAVPVLVDLWAPWCGPCRLVAPGVEQVSHELAGRVKAVKVHVDRAPGVGRRLGGASGLSGVRW